MPPPFPRPSVVRLAPHQEAPSLIPVVVGIKHALRVANPAIAAIHPPEPLRGRMLLH